MAHQVADGDLIQVQLHLLAARHGRVVTLDRASPGLASRPVSVIPI
jgi:hypothetical protein